MILQSFERVNSNCCKDIQSYPSKILKFSQTLWRTHYSICCLMTNFTRNYEKTFFLIVFIPETNKLGLSSTLPKLSSPTFVMPGIRYFRNNYSKCLKRIFMSFNCYRHPVQHQKGKADEFEWLIGKILNISTRKCLVHFSNRIWFHRWLHIRKAFE